MKISCQKVWLHRTILTIRTMAALQWLTPIFAPIIMPPKPLFVPRMDASIMSPSIVHSICPKISTPLAGCRWQTKNLTMEKGVYSWPWHQSSLRLCSMTYQKGTERAQSPFSQEATQALLTVRQSPEQIQKKLQKANFLPFNPKPSESKAKQRAWRACALLLLLPVASHVTSSCFYLPSAYKELNLVYTLRFSHSSMCNTTKPFFKGKKTV